MELLKKLTQTPGTPGMENEIRSLIRKEMEGLVDEIRVDNLGSLIGIKRGKEGGPKVMIAAHMDQIGFMVSYIDDNGYLRLQPTGGFDPRTMMAQRVWVHGKEKLLGVMGSKPVHVLTEEERKKPLKVEDYFVDLGLSGEKVKELVRVGDMVTWIGDFSEVGDMYCSIALDDRVGVYAMLEALKKAKDSDATIYAVATVQEEVGIRGSIAAAAQINPDVGIAVDVTIANDVPGAAEKDRVSTMGGGVAINLMNGATIASRSLVHHLMDLAEAKEISYQTDILPKGGTDAGGIWRIPGGAHAGTLSVPSRYVHSTVELVHKDDVQATIDLLAAYIEAAGERDYSVQ